jgi:hypothetical protein
MTWTYIKKLLVVIGFSLSNKIHPSRGGKQFHFHSQSDHDSSFHLVGWHIANAPGLCSGQFRAE